MVRRWRENGNPYKDGERTFQDLDPADLNFHQLRQLAAKFKANMNLSPGKIRRMSKGEQEYWWNVYKHPLHAYMDMCHAHYNECVFYGCGCDGPDFELVNGKVV